MWRLKDRASRWCERFDSPADNTERLISGQFKSATPHEKRQGSNGQALCTAPLICGVRILLLSRERLLARTTLAGSRTLRDARVIQLAANYIVGIALLEPREARLTARSCLCLSGG